METSELQRRSFEAELDFERGDEILIEAASSPSELVPRLWARGITRSRGEIVALTLASMSPDPGWASAVRTSMERDVAGVGGPIEPEPALSALEWAIHLCRYSRYMLPLDRAEPSDLPGDNSAYRREALEECRSVWGREFWETEVDERLREAGRRLRLVSSMVVRQGRSVGFAAFCANRFRHGVRSGETRGRRFSRAGALLRMTGAPVVPALLFLRIARRAVRKGRSVPLARCAPILLVFLACWSAGEAAGYWLSARSARA